MDQSTLVFDTFDVDLVVKVLANTAFSPFFTGMIPVFYYFHVGTLKNDTVVSSFCYFLLVSSFCASALICAASVLNNRKIGLIKLCSRAYRNHVNILSRSPPLDWSEQVVVITGGSSALHLSRYHAVTIRPYLTGASGVGELLANTLAVRNVTVVVLDVKPIVTENCEEPP